MPAYKLICRQCHKVISEGRNFVEAAERVPAETQWIHNAAYCSRSCLNEERAFEAARSPGNDSPADSSSRRTQ